MDAIDQIVAELKSLPPDKQKEVAEYVHQLKSTAPKNRREAFRDVISALEPGEVDEMEKHTNEACEQVDHAGW